MKNLPSENFQNSLRPYFQKDEVKLIAIGDVLGALAGVGKFVYVFGY